MDPKYNRVKYACYTASMTMSVTANLSPILFLTFRSLYGISYSLLGLLILINFVSQLIIDLIFSFFSHKFNIEKTVKSIPVISSVGFLIYGIWPFVFPDHVYVGIVLGTIVFSAASGLSEVLMSPVIAAIPTDDPDREMSKLHSVYAWGVVFVVVISTVFLFLAGSHNWQWLVFLFLLIPVSSAVLFAGSTVPPMETPERASGALKLLQNSGVWLSVFAIFMGGAAECTMAQWCSGYLEQAMGIPKLWGDLFGVALFSATLGIGRSWYAKKGRNIEKVLFFSMIGATVCYFLAAVSSVVWIGLVACAMTGLCTAMLWPGNLVVASDRFPQGGVFIYALMAAGGDLGASVAPQLVGIVTDAAIAAPKAAALAESLTLTPEQLGMKLGMLCGMLFPLAGIFITLRIWKQK